MAIRRSTDGGVRTLTIDRPERRNALTPELRAELTDEVFAAASDGTVRAVLLTGAGDTFCAGADISGPPVADRSPGEVERQVREGVQALVASVLDCPKPVVAAVPGVAAGIGAHLAFACDVVVAGESARFIEAFVRRGLAADGGGAWLLTRLVGLRQAKRLLLFGDEVCAGDARALGLVDVVVADEAVLATAAELAQRLADGPTVAIAAMKRMANLALDQTRAEALELEARLVEQVRATADATEGLRAFAERRPPKFTGS